MIKHTYLFYDIETTGLNKCFDQVVQFAAIRTDLELNELSRHEILVQLNPDVVPMPQALITHRISFDRLMQGVNEYCALKQIHELMNMPGTISLGYNTLAFDDEFLRFSFYRNLLPPYTHQYANQCRRMDLLPIAILYYLYQPDVLIWPEENGKTNLKLENLNQLNKLANGQAHDAMVDVEATLALARIFRQRDEMWKFIYAYFDKKTDFDRMHQLPAELKIGDEYYSEALVVDKKLGSQNLYQAPVMCLGSHLHYKNQSLWLRLDTEKLIETKLNNISENTYVLRKRAGEPPIILAPRKRFTQRLDSTRLQLMEQNKKWLTENPKILEKIREYHRDYKYPDVEKVDLDAALYLMDFASEREEYLFRQFHAAKPEAKWGCAMQFPNEKRRELALRIMGRHFKEFLDQSQQQAFQEYLNYTLTKNNQSPIDFRGEVKMSLQTALQQIEQLMHDPHLDEQQRVLLGDLQKYLSSL